MSSIWGWITYPYYWWSSEETEQPVTEQLLGSPTNNPNDIVDIRSHNVTIWCNDQTCTTMKCDKTQCRNISCSIYDTDYKGECREYNNVTDSEKNKTTETILPDKTETPTETYHVTSLANKAQVVDTTQATEDKPLDLEKALSATVIQFNVEKLSESNADPTTHKTKVSNYCLIYSVIEIIHEYPFI